MNVRTRRARGRVRLVAPFAFAIWSMALAPPSVAVERTPPGLTEMVNVDATGSPAFGASMGPSVSEDGSLVAFITSSRLLSKDSNRTWDVYLRERKQLTNELISIGRRGRPADEPAEGNTSMSANGRFVAFVSAARNLVRGDTNGELDVFVRDRRARRTYRVSVSTAGRQGNGESSGVAISEEGRYVAFTSEASNLVRHDTNRAPDVFVHDLVRRRTIRVSVSSSECQSNGSVVDQAPSISSFGTVVAFDSEATNLVRGDRNRAADVFVRDLTRGVTRRVSRGLGGKESDSDSFNPELSGSGRHVAFSSWATNLVNGDTNELMDIFVYDRIRGRTTRVNINDAGEQTDGNRSWDDPGTFGESGAPDISDDGRLVTFQSTAYNLVTQDLNASPDIFLHDRRTKLTTRESVSSSGEEAHGWSMLPRLSSDGRWVTFVNDAVESGLVESDPNLIDIFVHGPLW
jgi:Tol biopolymer transport system component